MPSGSPEACTKAREGLHLCDYGNAPAIALLADSATVARDDVGGIRAAGEMSWFLPGPPGLHDFCVYESAIDRLVTQVPVPTLLMFLYDLDLFGASILVDVLKTHATVLLGGTVLANPHHLTPQQYLATRSPSTLAEQALVPPEPDGWASLTWAERRIALLVAGGLTNKRIAQRLTLSRHTVDAHLKHAFTKLAIHSRVDLTVLARWLPIIDNLELALDHATAGPDNILEGLRAVHQQALDVLAGLGFPRRDDVGKPFDPAHHEAVGTVQDEDLEPGTVAHVIRAGYGSNGEVLRPASVVVATRRP